MNVELKFDLDQTTTIELNKKTYYQKKIIIISNSFKIIIDLDSKIDKKLAKGILRELKLKKYINVKNIKEIKDSNDINITDEFYIENDEIILVYADKKIILPVTEHIFDSILIQNIVNINVSKI